MRYEVAVSLRGEIVSVSGPCEAGSYADLKIFNKTLRNSLLPGEKVIADRDYRSNRCITPEKLNGADSVIAADFRARHETINRRIKRFAAVHHQFRHDLRMHAFRSFAANLIQMSLQRNPTYSISHLNSFLVSFCAIQSGFPQFPAIPGHQIY